MRNLFLLSSIIYLQFLLINPTNAQSSCLPSGITFQHQYEIDEFPLNYPGCSEILGDVTITGENIFSIVYLDSLIQITSIDGNLKIAYNEEIDDLTGLNNLTSIGGNLEIRANNNHLGALDGLNSLTSIDGNLHLIDNDYLSDISALSDLSTLGGFLNVYNNDELTNLTGLNALTSIGNSIQISQNDGLTSLTGLNNVSSAGKELYIWLNSNLANLSALSSLSSIGGYLYIVQNGALTNLNGLENLTSIDGHLTIHDNYNLTSLSGIQNIDPNTIEGGSGIFGDNTDLAIYNNEFLSECEVQSICDFLDIPDQIKDIHDNKIGCNSETEIKDLCPTPPDCTSLTNPTDGSTNVNITTDLSWNAVSDVEGYKLYVGTESGGTDIEDGTDVGNVTTYDPGDFPCGSTIYVTIVPYNDAGDATGCDEESFSTEDVTANAGSDGQYCAGGSVQLNASGGTTYSWSPTTGLDDPNVADPIASPSSTTVYTVTVSNYGRCPDTDQVTVTVHPNPIPNATATDETANDANDGTATSNPSNGQSPYSYAWSNGATTQSISGLSPANYTVTVTDNFSCSANETVTVNEFVCPTLTIIATIQNVNCKGACDGSITITGVTNGVAPFSYAWSNGATTATNSNLCPGNYTVTVTDNKNCTVSNSYTITEPTELLADASATDETANDANDGTAISNTVGGTPPYSYSWSNGATTQSILGLTPGNYTVTVTDANSCTDEQTVTVNEYICATLTIIATKENVTCNSDCDGYIEISDVTNGIEPLTYAWSNGATTAIIDYLCANDYTVTVTDSKNCSVTESYTVTEPEELVANASATDETANDADDGTATANPTGGTLPYYYDWSNGETTQSISGLSPGTYTVTVTDDFCADEQTVTVNEYGCPQLTIEETIVNIACFEQCNGSITINSITNGTAPFTYSWSNGKTTQSIDSLCPGDYSVTVIDKANCSVVEEYIITEPSLLIVNISTTDETASGANDGTATANPTGGISPYTYAWSNGMTTQTIIGLSPDTYAVTVTDQNFCSISDSVTVYSFSCSSLSIISEIIAPTCYGDCDASITIISVNAAIAPLKYLWNTGDTTGYLSNICTGDYSVTVTDANDCTVIDTFTVDKEPIEIVYQSSEYACKGKCNGHLEAYAFSEYTPVKYLWSTGDTTRVIDNLCAGTYTLTVTDSNECSRNIDLQISTFPDIEVTIEKLINVTDSTKGSIYVQINNHNRAYGLEWVGMGDVDYHSEEKDIDSLEAGCYQLVVWDNLLYCSVDTIICIEDKSTSIFDLPNQNNFVNIYPNPANKILYVKTIDSNTKINTIEIYNLAGKRLIRQDKNIAPVDISSIDAGLYFVKIKTNNGSIYKKLVISR